MSWLLVTVGGMIGAPLRYLADRAVRARHGSAFPWGTFAVNVTGCLLLGLVTGAAAADAAPPWARDVLATGLLGALTTYSTFSWETLRLAETGSRPLAAANVLLSLAAGLGAGFLGTTAAGLLWP
ncbi:fluoride efflux transporter CrcB [Streptomyces sp. 7-21]|uniref:fluoride efflux transporter CrcB n=1 Tax=Streptomyces sp. 7-21 TaxID=2802283 RepID=UPI00191D4FEB|nr:fluoride efflux transporter CrcB [Streptomyces sp. 7-21]MBL1067616.1 fluoride efflux transporter CrcB [Streptomyces sp. 7-21]